VIIVTLVGEIAWDDAADADRAALALALLAAYLDHDAVADQETRVA
jgi:hypothetical protein